VLDKTFNRLQANRRTSLCWHNAVLAWYMLANDILSIRLPICLSVTPQYCLKTAKHRITKRMPHDRQGLVFLNSYVKGLSEIQMG